MSEQKPIRIVHYVNQFFGGIGGEEQAGAGVRLMDRTVGPALGLQQALGNRGTVVSTLIAGDDHVSQDSARAAEEIRKALIEVEPDCVVAGPAFNSGRYGLACGVVCRTAAGLSIPAFTAMFPGNPAVDVYRKDVLILPVEATARGMKEALARCAEFSLRLCSGESLGAPGDEGYLPRGIRKNARAELPAGRRAVAMLLAKLADRSFSTEIPLGAIERVEPAQPIADLAKARLALVSTGGIVPKGNPDHLKHVNESRWYCYSIRDRAGMLGEEWEPIHGGFDASFAKKNPNVVVPLDVLRRMQSESRLGEICDDYYAVVGVGASPATCRRIGDELAEHLERNRVSGVILTST